VNVIVLQQLVFDYCKNVAVGYHFVMEVNNKDDFQTRDS